MRIPCLCCGAAAMVERPAHYEDDPPVALCSACDAAMPPPREPDAAILSRLSWFRDYAVSDPAPPATGARRIVCSSQPDQPCSWLELEPLATTRGFKCSGNAETGTRCASAAGSIE